MTDITSASGAPSTSVTGHKQLQIHTIIAPAKDTMICDDHLHLNEMGIEAVAEQTAKVIRSAMEEML